jgi:hypothetical protein
MYVILTSKPGQFRTEPGDGLLPVERYDYLFCGRLKARFVIAELPADPSGLRVRVVEEGEAAEAPLVNRVPVKFLERFDSLARARRELEHLTRLGSLDTALVRND